MKPINMKRVILDMLANSSQENISKRLSVLLFALLIVITGCGTNDNTPNGEVGTVAEDVTAIATQTEGGEDESLVAPLSAVPLTIYQGEYAASIPGAPQFVGQSANVNSLLNVESTVVLPTIEPLEIDENIGVGGSGTVDSLTRRLYGRFVREGYAGVMKIERVGSAEGFRLLCSTGTADIVNTGRPVLESERTLCSSLNREPTEFVVGQGALLFIAHPENGFLQDLSPLQARTLLTATVWSDVNAEWPDEPIQRYFPAPESDEFFVFTEFLLDNEAREQFVSTAMRSNQTTFFARGQEVMQAVERDRYGIGLVNYALWQQTTDEYVVRPVSFERLLPSAESVFYELYSLTFPLYLYTDPGILRNKRQVAAFVNFYLSNVNEEIASIGYFPAKVEMLDAAKIRLMDLLSSR